MGNRALFFFFNDTATTEIYTLSLHDALPIWSMGSRGSWSVPRGGTASARARRAARRSPSPDRKSTRLNSSHGYISYAVFCLKKKNAAREGPDEPDAQRERVQQEKLVDMLESV